MSARPYVLASSPQRPTRNLDHFLRNSCVVAASLIRSILLQQTFDLSQISPLLASHYEFRFRQPRELNLGKY